MRDDLFPAFETFLVQDVILTLGNLRGSLAWLAGESDRSGPGARKAGLERLDCQIEQLQDRARAMCRTLSAPPDLSVAPGAAPYADGSGLSLESLLRDALGDEAASLPPLFRSQRASHA
jgi:hypothetical protein